MRFYKNVDDVWLLGNHVVICGTTDAAIYGTNVVIKKIRARF